MYDITENLKKKKLRKVVLYFIQHIMTMKAIGNLVVQVTKLFISLFSFIENILQNLFKKNIYFSSLILNHTASSTLSCMRLIIGNIV